MTLSDNAMHQLMSCELPSKCLTWSCSALQVRSVLQVVRMKLKQLRAAAASIALGQQCKAQPALAGAESENHDLCVICMETAPEVSFQPCGHAVTCRSCAAKVVASKRACPMCRGPLQDLLHLHQ